MRIINEIGKSHTIVWISFVASEVFSVRCSVHMANYLKVDSLHCFFAFGFFFLFQTFHLWELGMNVEVSLLYRRHNIHIYWNRKSYVWSLKWLDFCFLTHHTNWHSWIHVEIAFSVRGSAFGVWARGNILKCRSI